MDFDNNGIAIPGTYAISTVHLGAWGEGGKPMPTCRSAVCDECGEWASTMSVAERTKCKTEDIFTDVRVSRSLTEVVYACPIHADLIVHRLLDEYGGCSNRYDPDELALAVDRSMRQNFDA